jgi:predicted amidohydrolase
MTTRVAAWQCPPAPLDVKGNLIRLDGVCALAASRYGIEVLVTPEMFVTGYAISRTEVERFAEEAGGPIEAAVSDIAQRRRISIVYGYPERAPDGAVYNAATMIGPDGVVRGRHRKVHLYGDVDREQFAANPQRPQAFDFDGSRVGMLICYDVEFPESMRRLAIDGARTVLVPTANMTGCEEVQEFLVRARACENNCYVVYANYCGADSVFQYNGRSMICGPRGEVLEQGSATGEQLVSFDLPDESVGTYLADRRADLYGG